MSTFESELKNTLHRALLQSRESVGSRRVEGALVRSEETVHYEYVTIIVDSSISKDDFDILSDRIYKIIKHDEFYRWSKYRIILWDNNELSLVSKPKMQVGRVKDCLKEIDLENGSNGSWETFWELYKPHKKAGRVIMLTTSEMIEELRNTKPVVIRNLVITYCGDAGNRVSELISHIPCIACISKQDHQRIQESVKTMNTKNKIKFAELNVEVVDTWRVNLDFRSGDQHYWIYFLESRIGGDTDDEYPVDKKDMDELIDSINGVISSGGILTGCRPMDYYQYNKLAVFDEDNRNVATYEWYSNDEEDDPSQINRRFYKAIRNVVKYWH